VSKGKKRPCARGSLFGAIPPSGGEGSPKKDEEDLGSWKKQGKKGNEKEDAAQALANESKKKRRNRGMKKQCKTDFKAERKKDDTKAKKVSGQAAVQENRKKTLINKGFPTKFEEHLARREGDK